MSRRALALIAVLVAVALTATACADSLQADDLLGSDIDELGLGNSGDDAPEGRSNGSGRPVPLVNGVRLVDDECYNDEARCGRAQLSQTVGSPDRIEIAYRVVRDTGEAVPVVVLTRASTLPTVDLGAFEGRTVIEIGERGVWPSRPGLDCPEWNTAGPDDDDIIESTRACRDRLVNAGVAVGTDDLRQRATDVVDLLGALGYTEADIVAPARRASLLPHLATSMTIQRVFYVDPFFDGTDLVAISAQRVQAAVEFIWDQCAAEPECATDGSVADLFDTIASLDADPLRPPGREELVIDATVGVRMVTSQLDNARTAAFLPELHRMFLARDANDLAAVLDTSFQSRDESGITLACDQSDETSADGIHPLLQDWADRGARLYADLCPIWFTDLGERAAPADPYLEDAAAVTTSSWSPPALTDDVPHIVEPSVGRISEDCVWTAAAAWFDRGEADATSCTATIDFTSRTEEIVATAGDYYFDESTTVRLPVPEGWADNGNGTWTREADPVDGTLLDVWVRSELSPESARDAMISSWALADPTLETVQIGRREWFLATGPDLDRADVTYTVAAATIDGQNVAVVLGSDTDEHAGLRTSVLEPALAGVEIL